MLVILLSVSRDSHVISTGGSKNQNPPKFTTSIVFYRPIVSATCLNLQLQPPILPGRRTWTVDEIEVASSLNFSILFEC